MPTGEQAGAVYVSIDADSSPLLAKYAKAEADSRAAGQRIAQSLGTGFSQATGIVDQFGRTVSSSVIKPLEQVAPAAAKAAAGIKTVAAAAAEAETKTQSFVGVIPGLGRAAEHFINLLPGVGSAIMAAFPVLGAIALTENLVHIVPQIAKIGELFGGVSEEEKKAAEQSKHFSDEIGGLDRQVEALQVRFETLHNGASAGLQAEIGLIREQTRAAAAAYDLERQKLRGGQEFTSGGRKFIGPVHGSSVQMTPQAEATQKAALELQKSQEEGAVKLEEIRKKQEAEDKEAASKAKAILVQQRTDFKESYTNRLADLRANHDVLHNEELAFLQGELADAKSHGVAFAGIQADLNRQIGTLTQAIHKEEEKGAQQLGLAQVQYASRLRKEAIKDLVEDGQLLDRATADITKKQEAFARSRNAEADIQDRAGKQARQYSEVVASGQGQSQKLQAQIAYDAQVVHTRQQEIAYAAQLERIEADSLKLKLDAANANVVQTQAALQLNPVADQLLKLQQALTAQKQAQLTLDNQSLETHLHMQKLQRSPLRDQIIGAGQRIPAQLGGAVASGVTGGNMGREIARSLKGIGQQMLGNVFDKLITQIAVQTGVTTLLTGILGLHTAAVSANTVVTGVDTVSTIANTVSTDLNTFWLSIKSFLGFADGGRPPVGVPSIVGERGPELFIPDGPGVIIPNVPKSGSVGIGSNALTSSMSVSNASQAMTIGAIHLHGVRDLRDVAKRLPALLKAVAPNFSPATR